jgi:hypothetical protein
VNACVAPTPVGRTPSHPNARHEYAVDADSPPREVNTVSLWSPPAVSITGPTAPNPSPGPCSNRTGYATPNDVTFWSRSAPWSVGTVLAAPKSGSSRLARTLEGVPAPYSVQPTYGTPPMLTIEVYSPTP